MVCASSLSARTTNPDGRNGRRPTTVRVTRSGETRTRANRRRGSKTVGGRRRTHPPAAPAAANAPAAFRKSRRRIWEQVKGARERLERIVGIHQRSPHVRDRAVVESEAFLRLLEV